MSISKQLWETKDIWIASCLVYLYGNESLATISDTELDTRRRVTTYGLAVPEEDAKIVVDEYVKGQLVFADAHAFVATYNNIAQRQKTMRLRGDDSWHSAAWIAGKVG